MKFLRFTALVLMVLLFYSINVNAVTLGNVNPEESRSSNVRYMLGPQALAGVEIGASNFNTIFGAGAFFGEHHQDVDAGVEANIFELSRTGKEGPYFQVGFYIGWFPIKATDELSFGPTTGLLFAVFTTDRSDNGLLFPFGFSARWEFDKGMLTAGIQTQVGLGTNTAAVVRYSFFID